jgi:hypothetical protein
MRPGGATFSNKTKIGSPAIQVSGDGNASNRCFSLCPLKHAGRYQEDRAQPHCS